VYVDAHEEAVDVAVVDAVEFVLDVLDAGVAGWKPVAPQLEVKEENSSANSPL
jgi:hypothetical protein